MIEINFIDAFEKLGVWVKDVKTSVIKQAIRRSIKRSSKTLQKEVFDVIRANRKIKLKDIKGQYTKLVESFKGDNPWRFYAEIKILEKEISLIYFVRGSKMPRKQKGKRVKSRTKLKVEIVPGQVEKRLHAFIAKAKGGNFHVFTRKNLANKKDRLPIRKESVPGVAKLFVEQAITRPLLDRVGQQLQKEFVSNLRYYLNKSVERAKSATGLGEKS